MKSRSGFTDSERAMMQLSRETIEGLHMTGAFSLLIFNFLLSHAVKSFTKVTRYLLSLPEVQGHYLLSENFSQDPIEN